MPDGRIGRREFIRDAASGAAGIAAGLGTAHLEAAAKKPAKATIRNYNENMEYRRLGKTGLMISAVSLGGHWKRVNVMRQDFARNRREVVSPTFVLVHEYQGQWPVYHLDAYRVVDEDEFLQLGPEEYFDGDGLTLVEWADRVRGCLPPDRVEVHIELGGPESRRFEIVSFGAPYEGVIERLRAWAGA